MVSDMGKLYGIELLAVLVTMPIENVNMLLHIEY